MKAYDFEFDQKRLGDFGFMIVNFGGSKGLETIDGAEITFNTIPARNGSIHLATSTVYESCLETTMQIAKYSCSTGIQEISSVEFREISKWLNRRKFLKFKLLEDSYIDLYYMASVVSISKIELDGRLMGLELHIITNSPHSFKEPRNITIQARYLYAWEKFYIVNGNEKGKSSNDYVFSYNRDAYPDDGCVIDDNGNVTSGYYYVFIDEKTEFKNQHSINDTSYEEGYIYPEMEITVKQDGDLKIYNAIEDRSTYIANCKSGEVITLDYPVIQSSDSSHNIQNDFNWNFFRIANAYDNSRNDLTISLPCSIKIKYSPIVKVGL